MAIVVREHPQLITTGLSLYFRKLIVITSLFSTVKFIFLATTVDYSTYPFVYRQMPLT